MQLTSNLLIVVYFIVIYEKFFLEYDQSFQQFQFNYMACNFTET